MSNLKTVSLALAGATVLLLVAIQFVPWATYTVRSGGGDFAGFSFPSSESTVEGRTWEVDQEVSGGLGSGSQETSWYDNDLDDADGVGLLRTAIPILLAGGAVALVGGLLTGIRPTPLGGLLALGGGALLIVATVLFAVGLDQFYDGFNGDPTWHVSFYLAIVACTTAIGAGATGLMESRSAAPSY